MTRKRKKYDPRKVVRDNSRGLVLFCRDFDPDSTDINPNDLEIKRKGLPVTMTEMKTVMHPSLKFRWQLTCGIVHYSHFHDEEIGDELELTIDQAINFDELNQPFKMAFKELEKNNPNFQVIKRYWEAKIL